MTHRIISVKPLDNFVVSVVFQNGIEKEYDVKQLFDELPQFKQFEQDGELFGKVKVDVGGYGISWNDELDLAVEEIWARGTETLKLYEVDIKAQIGSKLTEARVEVGITQKQLAEKTGIYQADISNIERGKANPSIQTLERLAEGMGMKLRIEFE